MLERETERMREREPGFDQYEYQIKMYSDAIREHQEGRRVVKFADIPCEIGKQGASRFYSSPAKHDTAALGWTIFFRRTDKPSGRHIHQGGIVIYVLDGKGHTVVDGVRFDWKKGDLLILPFKPGGVEHQHFNDDPSTPSNWVAFVFDPWLFYTASNITQTAVHEDWRPPK